MRKGLRQGRATMAGENKKKTSRYRSLLLSCFFRFNKDTKKISSETSRRRFPLNDLPVILLEEVLLRLPIKSAFQCKGVCKDWYIIITSPYFIRRFLRHRSNHQSKPNPSTLIINYRNWYSGWQLFTLSNEPIFKSRGFELNRHLLLHDCGKIERIKVLAVYKDLILCTEDEVDRCGMLRYYVCNPFTMQWLALPLVEDEHDEYLFWAKIGFICEPYYFEDSKGEYTLNFKHRFRVVLVNEVGVKDGVDRVLVSKQFVLSTYCSENNKWRKSVLDSNYRPITDVVAYNGKLLWYNGWDIFAYDPFNPKLSTSIDCSYIHSTKFSGYSLYCLGVCQGLLRMMQLVDSCVCRSLAVWVEGDYAKGEWSLEAKVYLDAIREMVPESRHDLRPLGFHLSDKDVVYLYYGNFVFSCNMRTSELKAVREVPCQGVVLGDLNAFNIELLLWPTPIHKPIEINP